MARLVFHRGQDRLLEAPLHGTRFRIGRSDACDMVVPGEQVSRTHCVLQRRDEGWVLVDRSRHGTRVGGVPVDGERLLVDGDSVEIGGYRLLFRTGEDAPPDRTRSTLLAAAPAEQLVVSEGGQLSVNTPLFTVVEGPDAGRTIALTGSRQAASGAPGANTCSKTTRSPHRTFGSP